MGNFAKSILDTFRLNRKFVVRVKTSINGKSQSIDYLEVYAQNQADAETKALRKQSDAVQFVVESITKF